MKIKLLKSMMLFGAMLMFGFVQAQSVSGTVIDNNGVPVAGANVIVKGTSNGAQSDFDGNYSLNNVASDATLVFSYVGYESLEIAVSGQSTVNATLQEGNALDEVIVIGYGTTTVKDATGAVTSVTAEDFNGGIISSPEQLIQGKTAGVQISSASGEPGAGIAIRIRGSNSIRSNNNPLFVVDGVPLSGESTTPSAGGIIDGDDSARNPLSFINPNDIESISVLKDASATAIYGSRGANGVVIVTTKSGRSGKGGTFEFNTNISRSTAASEYDLFDADEYRAQNIAAGTPVPAFDDLGANTDWQDVITRSPLSITNNLSYSRNYGAGNVRATLSYGNQIGVLENSGQERITGRLNASHRFLDNKLKLNLQLSASRVNDESPQISGGSGASGNLIGAAYAAPPTWPNDPNFVVDGNRLNPRNILDNFLGLTVTNRTLLNGSVEYALTNELTAKINGGYDYSDAAATSAVSRNYNNSGRITGNGQASRNTLRATSKLLEATLNYKKDFDNSSLDALVGYSFQDFQRRGYNAQAWSVGNDNPIQMNEILENSISSITGLINGPYQQFGYDVNGNFLNTLFPFNDTGSLPFGFARTYKSLWLDTFDNTDELQSFFGRVNYTINNKFIITATVRADGSSRFGPDEKYGIFPSGAFAWKLSEEDFVGDNVSTLKLRLSAGLTGNQAGLGYANYLFRQRFGGPGISNDGTIVRPGIEAVSFQNDKLKWESTTDFNLGLDFGFNNDRFRGSVDVYRKETNDLLFLRNSAQPADQPTVFENLEDGIVINQGLELALGYDFIDTDDMSFSADFNISYNQNEVRDLQEGFFADLGPLNGPGLTGSFAQRLAEGQSLFSYYMAEFTGFQNGTATYVDVDGNGDQNPGLDKKFVDKSALPDLTTGLSLNFRKGNFDVNAYFAGQFGFYVYNNTANAFLNKVTFDTSRNGTSDALGLLTQEVSTLYLEKGDFIRLQNLSVGYNFPVSGKGVLNSLRMSLTGQNLFIITDYSGLDPEVSSNTGAFSNGIPSAGIDYTSFPRPRTYTLGINATF